MNKYINKLLDTGLRNIISNSNDKLIMSDKILQKDSANEDELEKEYLALNLDEKERMIVNDYIACIKTVEERVSELSYIAGVRDAIKFHNALGLLKGTKRKKIKKHLKINEHKIKPSVAFT